MTDYRRYAIFHCPPDGPLSDLAGRWLGWDSARAEAREHPDPGALPLPVEEATRVPRKYGFHATLRPPFRPAEGLDAVAIADGVARLAARLRPVAVDRLQIASFGGFLALRPVGNTAALDAVAAAVVEGSDGWRAPLSAEDYARRRPDRLSPAQRALLDRWGYPYVMDAFAFHMTLTGPLPDTARPAFAAALERWLGPHLPTPYRIEDLCLLGEGGDGRFRIVGRYPLSG